MMAAATAVEISNTVLIGVSVGSILLFLVPGAIVAFKPELKRLARWVRGTRHDLRVNVLLWLTEHRFQNIAAYLGLRPAELGIL